MKKIVTAALSIFMVTLLLAGCSGPGEDKSSQEGGSGGNNHNKEIVFADVGWDSIKLHNAVAGFIAVEAFGYQGWSEMTGSTTIIHQGVVNGEVDVHMENWIDNLDFYPGDIAAGKLKEVGLNFDDNMQGLYVPRYVIEGDAARGIEAVAPDLRTVADLINYPHLFPDDENPSKGRIYGAIPGWHIGDIIYEKMKVNSLTDSYEYMRPGSDSAMNAAITGAIDKGEPIVFYYWTPSWLMGLYDCVLLEDEPYDPEGFLEGRTACPPVDIMITTSNQFYDSNAEFVQFLEKYHTTSGMISDALAYMQESNANHADAAAWLLKQNDALLDEWLTPEQAALVRAAL